MELVKFSTPTAELQRVLITCCLEKHRGLDHWFENHYVAELRTIQIRKPRPHLLFTQGVITLGIRLQNEADNGILLVPRIGGNQEHLLLNKHLRLSFSALLTKLRPLPFF